MFSSKAQSIIFMIRRYYSSDKNQKKFSVSVIGAAGGIGQPLSLLFKLHPAISEIRLHDLEHVPGVAADLSHIETAVKVSHSVGKDPGAAMKGGVDVIVVPAGLPRKPGMKREDLFKANAQIGFDVAQAMAKLSPESVLLIITNPVNALVPIACETLKAAGKLNPAKIFGVSTLDSVRAATFVGELTCTDPKDVNIPLLGAHSGPTIVPILSRSNPPACLEGEKLEKLVTRIKEAGTEVVKAKAGKGSATLSTAYAAARLTFSIIKAMGGESNIVECAYVMSDAHPEVKYLSTPLLLGKCGVDKNLGIGKMNEYETKLFCAAIKVLQKDIKTGEDFVKSQVSNKKAQ